MNIREYYEQNATVSIHASLVALIPASAFMSYIVLISNHKKMILLVIPFLLYSFFCFQKYRLNQNRAKLVKLNEEEVQSEIDLLTVPQLLLTFLPAPTLRLQLFEPNGFKAGELRDVSSVWYRWFTPAFVEQWIEKRYGLYDHHDNPLAIFLLKRDRIQIITLDNQGVVIQGKWDKNSCTFGHHRYQVKKDGIMQEFSIWAQNNKQKVGQVEVGWIPLNWGERFVDGNTPVLKHYNLSKEEKLHIYCILILKYAYHNH
ncbi:hypothetical protein [Niallia sp. Krafla_26]|uniref:hypothetical protein n=1 Tax=Niallia sp. Krafla_26 TaxID=3064703 RepID=UPI003D166082